MQDVSAVLVEPGADRAEARVERLMGSPPPRVSASLHRPTLLDTRLVRAELSRLRGPGRDAAPAARRTARRSG